MIAAWMLYALVVGGLVAAAACVLEEGFRLARLPVRFVWLGALLALLALAAVAPLRTSAPPRFVALPAATTAVDAGVSSATNRSAWQRRLREAGSAAGAMLEAPFHSVAALGKRGNMAVGFAWAVFSLALLTVAAATALRALRLRRSWPLREVAGVPVRVSPGAGPAALGIFRPEVVVPAWLLRRTPNEQRLAVLHEREHIRARDPLALTAGCLLVALVPWNPAAWWMLSRLRAAVELDCDARVLRHGVGRSQYGSLLIDVAGYGSGLAPGVPALAGSPTTLERRLLAMTTQQPRFAAARAAALGALGLAVLLAACETRMPTTPEIEAMDVAAAETQANRLQMSYNGQGETLYYVDGKQVTAEEARALAGGRVATITISGKSPLSAETARTIRIRTRTVEEEDAMREGEPDSTSASSGKQPVFEIVETSGNRSLQNSMPDGKREALIVLDGKVVEESALRGIEPDRIETIEVLKGPAAAKQFSDPRAANGVILITTKPGAAKP